jgi:hypothetical protein
VWSDLITLESGQVEPDVNLTIPQAAAIRGIVVDESDQPVIDILSLAFFNVHSGQGTSKPVDGRFGTFAASPLPTEIRIEATGFQPYRSEPVDLKPGQMHFVKVVLRRQPPAGHDAR